MFSIHAVAVLSNDAYKSSVNFSAIFTLNNPVSLPWLIFFQIHCMKLLPNVPGGSLGPGEPWLPLSPASPLAPHGPLTRGLFRPQCPLSSVGARRPFPCWFPYVTCWPRGSRVSRHTWNSWRAKAGAITIRSICWKPLSALHVQRKQRFYFILMIKMST